MGAWDLDEFGNDDAADLLAELSAQSISERLGYLRSFLIEFLEDGKYIEVSDGSRALAIIAGISSYCSASGNVPKAIGELVDEPRVRMELCQLCRRALSRLSDPEANEWLDVWASEFPSVVSQILNEHRRRLAGCADNNGQKSRPQEA